MARAALTETEVQEQQGRICAAARELFREGGIDAVTLRAIASKLGWSYTTPYRYYRSKDEIVAALRTTAFQQFGDALHAAIADIPDPADALRALAQAYITEALRRPDDYRLMVDLHQGHENQDAELAAAKNRALGTCREILRNAIQAGFLDSSTDVNVTAHVFWAGAHGAVSLHLADQLVMDCSIDDLAEPLIRTLIAGTGVVESRG